MKYTDIISYIIPLIIVPTLILIYTIITELLDLIFNYDRINELLQHSDKLNIDLLTGKYQSTNEDQSKLTKSILQEMNRQKNRSASKYSSRSNSYYNKKYKKGNDQLTQEIYDIFKVR